MNKVMVSIRSPGEKPTLETIKQQFALTEEEIDPQFGVIATNPEDHVYTVLVDETAAGKLRSDQNWQVEGPYSNPRIEPFGPPKAE